MNFNSHCNPSSFEGACLKRLSTTSFSDDGVRSDLPRRGLLGKVIQQIGMELSLADFQSPRSDWIEYFKHDTIITNFEQKDYCHRDAIEDILVEALVENGKEPVNLIFPPISLRSLDRLP
ncbi:hypothetical protein HS088_TW18G00453 [Tripterygium wilfordii]|uniref:Uncharacterized protein n=1 Tax=Tripterygium wilfordii TaxID=458696 RepID=A0A7J7CC96_TRIWF|nr:hypothetical protein HS088_TW18G00453 [Tripterygium wilfordii]